MERDKKVEQLSSSTRVNYKVNLTEVEEKEERRVVFIFVKTLIIIQHEKLFQECFQFVNIICTNH